MFPATLGAKRTSSARDDDNDDDRGSPRAPYGRTTAEPVEHASMILPSLTRRLCSPNTTNVGGDARRSKSPVDILPAVAESTSAAIHPSQSGEVGQHNLDDLRTPSRQSGVSMNAVPSAALPNTKESSAEMYGDGVRTSSSLAHLGTRGASAGADSRRSNAMALPPAVANTCDDDDDALRRSGVGLPSTQYAPATPQEPRVKPTSARLGQLGGDDHQPQPQTFPTPHTDCTSPASAPTDTLTSPHATTNLANTNTNTRAQPLHCSANDSFPPVSEYSASTSLNNYYSRLMPSASPQGVQHVHVDHAHDDVLADVVGEGSITRLPTPPPMIDATEDSNASPIIKIAPRRYTSKPISTASEGADNTSVMYVNLVPDGEQAGLQPHAQDASVPVDDAGIPDNNNTNTNVLDDADAPIPAHDDAARTNPAAPAPLHETGESFPPVSDCTQSASRINNNNNNYFSTLVPSAQYASRQQQQAQPRDDVLVAGSQTQLPSKEDDVANAVLHIPSSSSVQNLHREHDLNDALRRPRRDSSMPAAEGAEHDGTSMIHFSNSVATNISHPLPNIASVSAISAIIREGEEARTKNIANNRNNNNNNNINANNNHGADVVDAGVLGPLQGTDSFPQVSEFTQSASHNYYSRLMPSATPHTFGVGAPCLANTDEVQCSDTQLPLHDGTDRPTQDDREGVADDQVHIVYSGSRDYADHFDHLRHELSALDAEKQSASSSQQAMPVQISADSAAIRDALAQHKRNTTNMNHVGGVDGGGMPLHDSDSFPPLSEYSASMSQGKYYYSHLVPSAAPHHLQPQHDVAESVNADVSTNTTPQSKAMMQPSSVDANNITSSMCKESCACSLTAGAGRDDGVDASSHQLSDDHHPSHVAASGRFSVDPSTELVAASTEDGGSLAVSNRASPRAQQNSTHDRVGKDGDDHDEDYDLVGVDGHGENDNPLAQTTQHKTTTDGQVVPRGDAPLSPDGTESTGIYSTRGPSTNGSEHASETKDEGSSRGHKHRRHHHRQAQQQQQHPSTADSTGAAADPTNTNINASGTEAAQTTVSVPPTRMSRVLLPAVETLKDDDEDEDEDEDVDASDSSSMKGRAPGHTTSSKKKQSAKNTRTRDAATFTKDDNIDVDASDSSSTKGREGSNTTSSSKKKKNAKHTRTRDATTTTEDDEVRLACMDTPPIKGSTTSPEGGDDARKRRTRAQLNEPKKPAKPRDATTRGRGRKHAHKAKSGVRSSSASDDDDDDENVGARRKAGEKSTTPHQRRPQSPNRWKRRMNFSFDERIDDDPYRIHQRQDSPPRPDVKPPIPPPSAPKQDWHQRETAAMHRRPMTFSVDDHPQPLHLRPYEPSSSDDDDDDVDGAQRSPTKKQRKARGKKKSKHGRRHRRRDGGRHLPTIHINSGFNDTSLAYYWPYLTPQSRAILMKDASLTKSEKHMYSRLTSTDLFLLKEIRAC